MQQHKDKMKGTV